MSGFIMKRALFQLFAGAILLAGTAILIWPDLSLFLASDACVGAGGSFDFPRVRCDFQQGHPSATFDLWPFWAAFTGVLAGIVLSGRGLLGLRLNSECKPEPLRSPA